MREELRRVLVDVTQREADRVVVITGAGGAF
jgi:enoyl-CoA hydratase/carnithine racemase